jgi:hypothetical protein
VVTLRRHCTRRQVGRSDDRHHVDKADDLEQVLDDPNRIGRLERAEEIGSLGRWPSPSRRRLGGHEQDGDGNDEDDHAHDDEAVPRALAPGSVR